MKSLSFALFSVSLLSATSAVQAANYVLENPLQFESSQKQAVLLEMYTSQGCSSCPPAQRWLNQLTDSSKLWKNIVPVAFHVDYWNYIGWTDPYSSSSHSKRQRLYFKQGKTSAVYTPGFFANGKEWRERNFNDLPATNNNAGILKVKVSPTNSEHKLNVKASYSNYSKGQRLNVAILGFGINTKVPSGENAGRTLSHDFTLLSHKTFIANSQNENKWQVSIDAKSDGEAKRYAIATWVSSDSQLKPLQATGSWLN